MKSPSTSHDAIVEPAEGPAYAGSAGRTRTEPVHLVQDDGSVASVQVYRVVNVFTHPDLRDQVLAGTLHRLADGRELAVPFVYHDPQARKFALVIPSGLAHMELKAWADLMQEVASEPNVAVPVYVKDSTTVIGVAALAVFLEVPMEPDDAELSEVEADEEARAELEAERVLLAQREQELREQEQRLITMGESLTQREGDLVQREEALVSLPQGRVPNMPEAIAVADERQDHDHDAQVVPERAAPMGRWQEVNTDDDRTRVAQTQGETVVSDVLLNMGALNVSDEELSEVAVTRPPPLRRTAGTEPPPLRGTAAGPTPPPLHPHRYHQDDPETVVTHADDLVQDAGADAIMEEDEEEEPHSGLSATPSPEVDPPEHFWNQRPGEVAFRLEQDEVWLFVHLDAAHGRAFRTGPELMIQYVEVADYPVVVIALVDLHDTPPYAVRLVLDPLAQAERAVVESLERSFRARVALYVGQQYEETLTVATLREGVARSVLDELKRPLDQVAVSPGRALARVKKAPPPVVNDDLPFGPARRQAASTATVLAAVEQLSAWLVPDKLRTAQFIYSVPQHVIDASIRRVLRAALAFGVCLPPELAQLAMAHRLADDDRVLVTELLTSFRQKVERGENDLGQETTVRNWSELFERARSAGVPIDQELRQLARGVAEPSPEGDMEELTGQALRAKLEDPGGRLGAIEQLCRRGHPAALEDIFRVLPDLPAPELAAALPHTLGFGEQVGDALLRGLTAQRQELRQGCALALGQLKLRRSLAPLLQQLDAETTAGWSEMARAVGDFGPSSLRTVIRAAVGARHGERFVAALAHLANHGGAREVEALENGNDDVIAALARKAMARRSRMEWEDLAIREHRTLADNSAEARFSQAFYAGVAKLNA